MHLASLRASSWLPVAALLSACAPPAMTLLPAGLHSPFTGYSSKLYREDRMWLCRPDLASDVCRDRARSVARSHLADRAQHNGVDCFYVVPTFDVASVPASSTDTADERGAAEATAGPIAPFEDVCSLYVPVYRQATVQNRYVLDGPGEETRSAVAFSDVDDAFLHYMGQYNRGRRVALVGDADLIARLLKSRFESDLAMRHRLLLAIMIGGAAEARDGRVAAGTFQNLPLCTRARVIGCVVALPSPPAGGGVGERSPSGPNAGVADLQLPIGDLIDIIARAASAARSRTATPRLASNPEW